MQSDAPVSICMRHKGLLPPPTLGETLLNRAYDNPSEYGRAGLQPLLSRRAVALFLSPTGKQRLTESSSHHQAPGRRVQPLKERGAYPFFQRKVHNSTSSGTNAGAYCSTPPDVFFNATSLAILRSYHACCNGRNHLVI
jgi:hypothetical protein